MDVRDGVPRLVKERTLGFEGVERVAPGVYCLTATDKKDLHVLTSTVDPSLSIPSKSPAAFTMARLDSDACGADSTEIDVFAPTEGQLTLSDDWGYVVLAH